MDVQNSIDAFSRLNSLSSRAGQSAGQSTGLNWVNALNYEQPAPAISAAQTQNQQSQNQQAPNQPADRAFANLLDKAINANPTPAEKTEESEQDQQLRKWAQTLVNKFFVGTMLKQMRDSPFKSEMFSGGRGGEAYQGMMDQHIAEHAGNKIAKSLVDSIVKSKRKAPGDPNQLFTDPQQQKKQNEYLKNQEKRVSNDSTTSLTA